MMYIWHGRVPVFATLNLIPTKKKDVWTWTYISLFSHRWYQLRNSTIFCLKLFQLISIIISKFCDLCKDILNIKA